MDEVDVTQARLEAEDALRRRKARPSAVCRCAAYSFPHRAGGGQCTCETRTTGRLDAAGKFVYTSHAEDLCGGCHLPAEGKFEDFGIGVYECWGAPGIDTNVQYVSVCCEAGFVKNQPGYPDAEWVSPSDFFDGE